MKWYQTKKQFLTGYSPKISVQWVDRMPSPVFLWNLHTLQVLPESLTSNQPESRCWLRSFLWDIDRAYIELQPLWTTKNKVCCLDNHSGSRDIQELRQNWTITFLQEATPSRLGEMAALANVAQKLVQTQRKKEEYVPNTRIRSDLNETKISDLSDRVQNKGH